MERINLWSNAWPSLLVIGMIVVFLLACVILSYAASRKVRDDVDRELSGVRTISLFDDEEDDGHCYGIPAERPEFARDADQALAVGNDRHDERPPTPDELRDARGNA